MRIDVHNIQRQSLFEVEVDPRHPPPVVKPAGADPANTIGDTEVHLRWEQALDDQGYLRRCPVCQCQELFVRRDFPQKVGLLLVAAAITTSLILFGMGHLVASLMVLGLMAVVDAAILHLLTGLCLVCYRCRSEFRDLPIDKEQHGWDLSTGEKYRPIHVAGANDSSAEPR